MRSNVVLRILRTIPWAAAADARRVDFRQSDMQGVLRHILL